MYRAHLVWKEDGRLKLAELADGRTAIIGRGVDATVVIEDHTVSRLHATIVGRNGVFTIEHLSQTNPTKVNGHVIVTPTVLVDSNRIQVGLVEFVFHDLAAADVIVGPICSFCSRENKATDKDCWYCGTSLVNAATLMTNKRIVICRMLSQSFDSVNLYDGQMLWITPQGLLTNNPNGESPVDATAKIEIREGAPFLVRNAIDTSLRLNDADPAPEQRLSSGDRLDTEAGPYAVIVR